MGIIYTLEYHHLVVHEDIPCLDHYWQKEIQYAIQKKLIQAPETFGQPLRQSLRGYRKLRVGDYRVIFRIEKTTIKILLIQHRSVAYKKVHQRLA